MSISALTRRAALSRLGVFAVFATSAARSVLAQPGGRFRDIRVDVSPLRASAGDPTTAWVQQELPAGLAKVLAGYVSRPDRAGATLVVRIETVYLGPSAGGFGMAGKTTDAIEGVLKVMGPRGGISAETRLRVTTSYTTSGAEQALPEEGYHSRVIALAQAFAGATPGQLGL
jgi:hypothetical protein